jgi:hypothetical protein
MMSSLFGNSMFHEAHVGPDLELMVDRMIASGVGPWYYSRELTLKTLYRGEPCELVLSAALGFTGNHMYELMMQHDDAPSSITEFLERHPDGGLHHIAYLSDDLDRSIARAEEISRRKFVRVQEFLGDGGKPTEIYLAPEGEVDPVMIQIVLPSPWDAAFDRIRQEAANWDGANPKRNMIDLLPDEVRQALAEGRTA